MQRIRMKGGETHSFGEKEEGDMKKKWKDMSKNEFMLGILCNFEAAQVGTDTWMQEHFLHFS